MEELQPRRQPRSSKHHRHIPVTAYSTTNADFVLMESGLEHDLLRKVDRDHSVKGMVSQPFTLFWRGREKGNHTPDLLTWHGDGSVVVWDARSLEKQNDDFRNKIAITALACQPVGWRHEVFAGLGRFERLNMLWLHGFRRRPVWAGEAAGPICAAAARSGATLGTLFACDDGSGELTAAVWHLIWAGVLDIDMDVRWDDDTPVALRQQSSGSRDDYR